MKTLPDTVSNVKQEMCMASKSDMQLALAYTDMQLCLF